MRSPRGGGPCRIAVLGGREGTRIACSFFGPTRVNRRSPFEDQGQQAVGTQGQGVVQVLGSAMRVLVLVLVLTGAVLAATLHGRSGFR